MFRYTRKYCRNINSFKFFPIKSMRCIDDKVNEYFYICKVYTELKSVAQSKRNHFNGFFFKNSVQSMDNEENKYIDSNGRRLHLVCNLNYCSCIPQLIIMHFCRGLSVKLRRTRIEI